MKKNQSNRILKSLGFEPRSFVFLCLFYTPAPQLLIPYKIILKTKPYFNKHFVYFFGKIFKFQFLCQRQHMVIYSTKSLDQSLIFICSLPINVRLLCTIGESACLGLDRQYIKQYYIHVPLISNNFVKTIVLYL